MRKLLALLMAGCMLISLTACGILDALKDRIPQVPSFDMPFDSSNDGDDLGELFDLGTSEPTLVAEPLESAVISAKGACVMDPAKYFGGSVALDGAWSSFNSYDFVGVAADLEQIEAYINLLRDEYGFVIMYDPYEDLYESGRYSSFDFEIILSYVGFEAVDGDLPKGDHTGYEGDCVISGRYTIRESDPKGAMEFEISFNTGIAVVDEGYRYGKDKLTVSYAGESFTAGLYLNSDGSYETDDGRLKASVGEAVMLSDGNRSNLTVLFNLNSRSDIQEIIINNSLSIQQVAFAFPMTRVLRSGVIYDENDLLSEHGLVNPQKNLTEDTVDLRYEGFRILHGEKYYMPQQGMLADFSRLNMRIMYVDELYSVAVIYFCAEFNSSPNVTECLMAVPLNAPGGGTSSAGTDGVYNIKVGDKLEIDGPNQFDSMYHTYQWSFVSGSELCEMHNTHSQTATVIAHKAGTVRIKLVYEYTEEKENLLGRYEDQASTRTDEYVIYITE